MIEAVQRSRRIVFGVAVDVISRAEVVEQIMAWCARGEPGGFIATPNLDHVLKLRDSDDLRQAYAKARLVVADGKPLVWMSRLDGGPPLDLVTGSDLIEPVCAAAAREGYSVFLFGTRQHVLERARDRLLASHPGLRIAGLHSPPMGFEKSAAENEIATAILRAAAPDILLLALGSPKQEIWAAQHAAAVGARATLCIGASLDFIAGETRRAPPAFRRAGAEWLWRAMSEPRRLGGRYARILLAVPRLIIGHAAQRWRDRRHSAGQPL